MLAVGLSIAGLAIADDDDSSKRKELMSKIDDAVEDAGDELSGFESDSDDGDLRDALSYISTVESLVRELDGKKGSDSSANDIVSRYPRYISDFRQAAQYLGRLKQGQRTADNAADRCKSNESDLQTMIRYYVGRPDEADDAFNKLPDKAREFQRTWQPQLEAWRRNDSEMANAASYARFSVSDGKWSRVSSNLSSALNAMHNYWREKFAAAERECTRLTLGEKHPDVDKAITDLRNYSSTTKQTVTQLKKDYNEWLREARKLRAFANDDRDAIRDAICRAGEYEVERIVADVADRWASQISSAYGTTLGQADRLRSRAEDSKLQKYKGSKWVLEALKTNLESLEKLKNYEMRGSANPKIRARIEWGKKRHEDLQSGCTIKEMVIERCNNAIRPGSGCRADCLKISSGTCKIVEIKPDSDGGRNEGPKQVGAYAKGLGDWYAADRKDLFADYPAVAACENDDKTALRIESEVIFYDFCSGTVRDDIGEVIKELSSDLPENAE